MLGIVGIIFIVCGIIFKVFPPKKVNSIYGYRTNFSMSNQERWNEAQKFSSVTMIILGLIFLTLELILDVIFGDVDMIYQNTTLIIGITLMFVADELHLRKVFPR